MKPPKKLKSKVTIDVTNDKLITDIKTENTELQKIPVTLSNDPALYFHTQAVELISDALKLDEGDRHRLAKNIFKAIHDGKIDAYSHKDGKLLISPSMSQPLCVRVKNLNDWLRLEGYSINWDPDNPNGMFSQISIKKTAEQRQAERWKLCVDMGLSMPKDTYERYPKGINEAAKRLGITRQSLREDLNNYRERFMSN